jgi:CBS-domain-containing membrane protein
MGSRHLKFDGHIRKENLRRYLLQCSLAGVVVFVLLLVLDTVTQTVLIAALGASTFIAFAVPLSLHSSPRHMIGGYVVGIISGCLMSILHTSIDVSSLLIANAAMIIFGALATSMAMFIMVVTRTEHPPAAALALGLVLNEWNWLTIVVVLAGVIGLSIFKRMVLPMLMDLL